MDNTISDRIDTLLFSIKESDIYREYRRQEEQLSQDPELWERVTQFRASNFRIQNEANREELFDAAQQLAHESAELRRYPEVNAYLDAELALCKMMQKICRKLTAGIDMHIPE